MEVNMKLDSKELQGYLKTIHRKLGNLRPAFTVVKAILEKSVTANFRMGGRPKKWKKLSPMTVAIRQKKGTWGRSLLGQNILFEYGQLFQSIGLQQMTASSMAYGTNLPKAHALQYGRRATHALVTVPQHTRIITQAFGRPISPMVITVRSHSKRAKLGALPKRPFILFQKQDIEAITQYLASFAFADTAKLKAVTRSPI